MECNKQMKTSHVVKEAALKVHMTCFTILNSGVSGSLDLHPLTLRKIYQTVVMPRLLYGYEFWHVLSESQRLNLACSHRHMKYTLHAYQKSLFLLSSHIPLLSECNSFQRIRTYTVLCCILFMFTSYATYVWPEILRNKVLFCSSVLFICIKLCRIAVRDLVLF